MASSDICVVGGGPAGLAAAIMARRRGLTVTVCDGSQPPIDKACGEGLMPDARRAASALGIDLPGSAGYEFRGIRFHGAGHSVESDFPRGSGLGLRRTVLHEAMVNAATECGVILRWNCPIASLSDIDARWIVGADGSGSRVRQWAGLQATVRNTKRFAFRQHFAIAPWTDCMEIYWGAGCQIYVTPVSSKEVCVALISRAQALRLQEALARFFPALHRRLAGSRTTSRERGALTSTMRLKAVSRGNVALIGDASGSVDAITGEGLCLSFKQAGLLAHALAAGDLNAYNRAHPRLARRPYVMSKAMLMLDKGAGIRRAAMTAMSWQPRIFGALLKVHVT